MTDQNLYHTPNTSERLPDAEPYIPKRFAKPGQAPRQTFLMPPDGFGDIDVSDTYTTKKSSEVPTFLREQDENLLTDISSAALYGNQQAHKEDLSVVTDEQLQEQMRAEQRAALSTLQASRQPVDEVCNPLYARMDATACLPHTGDELIERTAHTQSTQITAYMPRYNQQSEFFDAAGPEDYMPDDRPVLRTIKPEPEARPSKVRGCFSTLVMVAFILALSFLIRTYVVTPYEIPTGSMVSTINVGDRVFAERISTYLHPMPARGDIITFPSPEDPQTILIKRCIAIEGDTVNITEDGKLLINDVVQDEPYVHGQETKAPDSSEGKYPTYPFTVGKGQVWVMGDNRGNSLDSRYFGTIEASAVTGHAFACYWPLSRAELLTPVNEIIHVSDPNEVK